MSYLIINIVRGINIFLKKVLFSNYKILWKLYSHSRINELTFDHELDVFVRWPLEGKFHWGSIAAFNLEALHAFDSPVILELGCSDGFYSYYFFRHLSSSKYVGVDLDEENLKRAKKRLRGNPNYSFIKADFLRKMPTIDCTNVVWCESINMFSASEQEQILSQISERLSKHNGILSGTGVLKVCGKQQWAYYIGLFENAEELKQKLEKYFKNVFIYTRKDMPDDAVFFMASNGELPWGNGFFIKRNGVC